MEPIKYKDWRKEKRGEYLGVESLLTDRVLRRVADVDSMVRKASSLMGETLTKALARKGVFDWDFSSEITRKIEPTYRISLYGKGETDGVPMAYLYMAFNEWFSAYGKVKLWENKSLWQYLVYWFRRKL